jgi:hypothetical protein
MYNVFTINNKKRGQPRNSPLKKVLQLIKIL